MQQDDRYARQRLIQGWNQERVSSARVLVAGAGAVGNHVLQMLALVGIGSLVIIDSDSIEASNLSRCPLFRPGDVGLSKATVAAERLRELDPGLSVHAVHGDLQFDIGLGVYRAADLVIGCLDSLDARLRLNRACLQAGRSWLNAGIDAESMEVSLFGADGGACFECGMSASMWERRRERCSCTGVRATKAERPAATTAVMASLAASYLVQEALWLIQAEEPAGKQGLKPGQKVTARLAPIETAVYALARNPECCAHEALPEPELLAAAPGDLCAGDLLARAGMPDAVVELGLDLLAAVRCARCGDAAEVLRPAEMCSDDVLRCPDCRAATRTPEIVTWIERDGPLSRLPLAQLRIPDHAVLSVANEQDRRFFQFGGAPFWESRLAGA